MKQNYIAMRFTPVTVNRTATMLFDPAGGYVSYDMYARVLELCREAAGTMDAAIRAGDWKIDGACDPTKLIKELRVTVG